MSLRSSSALDSYQIPLLMNKWRDSELEMRDGVWLLAELRDGWEGYTMTRIIPTQVHMPISTLPQDHSKHPHHHLLSIHLHGFHLLVRCSATYLMDLEISLSQSLVPFPSTPIWSTPLPHSSLCLEESSHNPLPVSEWSEETLPTHCSLRSQLADNSVSQPS